MFAIRRTTRQALLTGAFVLWPAVAFSQSPEPKPVSPRPPAQNEKGSDQSEAAKGEPGSRGNKVSDRLRAAEELLNESHTEEALAEFQRAVEIAAGRPSELRAARFAYAQALSKLGRETEVAAQYQAAIRESGGRDPIAYFNLGNAYARAGQNQSAADAYRRAVEQRYGNYARAHNNLGLVLVRLGRYDEARAAYLRAIDEERGYYADAHYNLAQLYLYTGERKQAGEHLAVTLRIDPSHEDAAILLTQLTENRDPYRNDVESIVATLAPRANTRRVAPAPSSPEAGSAAAPTVAVSPAAFRLLQQARAARDHGEFERAATLYHSSLRTEGTPVIPIEWELAAVWMRLGNLREASEAYRRIIAKAGDRYPMAYYNLGRVMMQEGKYAGAAVMLRQALTRVGEQPYIYLALSESLERTGDLDGAIEALLKFGEMRPKVSEEKEEPDWYQRKLAGLREKNSKQ